MNRLRPYLPHLRWFIPLGLLTALALALRLLLLSWHAPYPLSGDEIGFFEQARTFVQGNGYHDLELMRGPAYPLFLAAVFRLFGAEVSAARLVQALLGTVTVPLLYIWAGRRHGQRAGLGAAALGALFFALAVQATFLLTETLFLFLFVLGMIVVEWTMERPSPWLALASGILFGLATLTRSVGLPLVVLAAVWVGWAAARARRARRTGDGTENGGRKVLGPYAAALLVLAGALFVLLPWTARNAVVYRSFILVDTTGTTNLWLDNDPELGRDRVKAELLKYPEGQRSALAVRNGLNSIVANPGWFLDKCWGEVKAFFSLEYFDDFRNRPAIWYPVGEVWARVLLGDGLYLLLVAAGLVGLVRRSAPSSTPASATWQGGKRSRASGMGLFDLLWLAYVLGTAALFHVELRYRLPFLVVLVPYAAAVLAHPRATWGALRQRPARAVAAVFLFLAFSGLLLAHANYPLLSGRIVVKRVRVALGERALARGDAQDAEAQARAALSVYGESSEARVLLAQALWREEHPDAAVAVLRQAIDYRSGHPHPHLLLGDLLRAEGLSEEAVPELAYERNSLEDLQAWLWPRVNTTVPTALDLGSGLELGFVHGWHLPEAAGDRTTFRWSDARVTFRLAAPGSLASSPRPGPAPLRLTLRLAAGRPEGLPLPQAEVWFEGARLGAFAVENDWHTYTFDVAAVPPSQVLLFELRSTTFRPHAYDPHLDDNRPLGVMVDWAGVSALATTGWTR